MEYVINHIMKNYEQGIDIARVIKTETKPDFNSWKPSMEVELSNIYTIREAEENQIELEFKAENANYMKQKSTYKSNNVKIYTLLWERFTETMQNKVSSRSDFDIDIYTNPINLKIAIKFHAMIFQENWCEMAIINESIKSVFNCKQKD